MEHEDPVISGIQCSVENCAYNNGCCRCTAGEIRIRNKSDNPEESICETFSEI